MTSIECFNVIDVALKNLERVTDVIRNMKHEKILELFSKAAKQESFEYQVMNLEASMRVNGKRISDVPQVNKRLVAIGTNQKDLEDGIEDFTLR